MTKTSMTLLALACALAPVSYTHLDVYKRQALLLPPCDNAAITLALPLAAATRIACWVPLLLLAAARVVSSMLRISSTLANWLTVRTR